MKIDIKNSKIENFYEENNDTNSLTSSSITCLYEYKDGSIWVGTTKGVNVIDKNSRIMTNKFNIYDDKLYIYNIEIDDLGKLY